MKYSTLKSFQIDVLGNALDASEYEGAVWMLLCKNGNVMRLVANPRIGNA